MGMYFGYGCGKEKSELIEPYPLTHQKGMLEITPKEQLLDFDPQNCDLGIQIAADGRIWLCVNGQALIRFKPRNNNGK